MKWTREQQQVIDLRNRNILVSAAAGSGKTAVLVERIIQMISNKDHPIDIDHLLIVTFTNAAAAEMKERISQAIEKKLLEMPDSSHLQKQMTLVHSAQVTTIHSFCLNVIRNNFNMIDMDPTFRIGDEAELTLLQSDVIASILEEEYERGEEEFLNFVESYSNAKSDVPLEELILQLYRFSMSYPWPEEWLNDQKKIFQMTSLKDMNESKFMKELLSYVQAVIADCSLRIQEAIHIANEADGPFTYVDALEKDIELMEDLVSLNTYKDYAFALSNLSFVRLSAKRAEGVCEDKKEQVKAIRDTVKKNLGDLVKSYFFQPQEQMLLDIQTVEPIMNVLIRLSLRFMQEYTKQKEEKVLVDFNDLEHLALKILVEKNDGEIKPTLVANELSEFYEEILIDEYQDSNLVQETLLTSVSKERYNTPNIFMVGDVKQSIYKFRLARPELFMHKYETYTTSDSEYQKIDLHKNFRSRAVVLESINFIFEQIMTKKLGNIEYDKAAALYPGADFPETTKEISTTTEIILVTAAKEGSGQSLRNATGDNFAVVTNEDEDEIEYSKKELEAKAIALRIKELVQGNNPLTILDKKDGYRRAKYKDIVILLRTMSNWADIFVDALMAEGIPAYTDTASGYFKTLEIKAILNYLKIIDNPLQDIPFAGVLHSPMVGLTNEEMASIRSMDREAYLYEAVLGYRREGVNETLRQKITDFLEQFHSLREMMKYLSIHELIIKLLEMTDYYEYVYAMPAGNVRRANIDMLIQKAITFENTSYKGLFHFVRYIEKLHKYDVDFGEASVSNENDDTVRIMSIHKSKGLEFPIVFVAGMGKNFNNQDSRSKLVIHPDMGLGPDCIDLLLRVKTPTLIKKVIQRMQVLENLGEELRVLYVALTRAKEKLIMTGYVPDVEKVFKKYQSVHQQMERQLEFLQLATAGTYLDYIIPALMRHEKVYQQFIEYLNPEMKLQGSNQNEQQPSIDLRIVTSKCLLQQETMKQIEKEWSKEQFLDWDIGTVYNRELRENIYERLNFEYPYQKEVELHAKITVSELKRLSQKFEDEGMSETLIKEDYNLIMFNTNQEIDQPENEQIKSEQRKVEKVLDQQVIPRFMQSQEVVTGADKGTLYHKVLEEIDLYQMDSYDSIKEEINRLIKDGKIMKESLNKININQLYEFSKSKLAARMRSASIAGKLYKEQQFVLGIQANEVNPEYLSDEIMLVQGIIDVFFEEEDHIILMDYKTDYVKDNCATDLINKYKVQLDYYQRALEQITGKKVTQRIIYSFYLGREINV